ncbi:unnamed protein product [Paramecium sonneborni]|uniref:Uncharacterized protein n=1 Tax=Paramecium sonneborni TaxID=65129 RepID=A0A8S1RME3_9CILI|nr:unnamed protein product [Paramecium sonneborni]
MEIKLNFKSLFQKADGIREKSNSIPQKQSQYLCNQQINNQMRVQTLPLQFSTLHQTITKEREKMKTKLTKVLEHD